MITNRTLKRRFILLLTIYSLLVFGLLFFYHTVAYRQISNTARENMEYAANTLLQNMNSEVSGMKIVASAIAGSTYVQDFLIEEDVSAYYEKAATVAEIIRKTTYPDAGADNILTLNNDGTWYRFTGGLSDESCKILWEKYIAGALYSYTIEELDEAQYFCYAMPVYARTEPFSSQIGAVVLLNNLEKTKRKMAGGMPGVNTALIMDGTILLSDNPMLEEKSDIELAQLYKEVSIAPVPGTSLSAAAVITDNGLKNEETIFLLLTFSVLALFLLTIILFYRYLFSRMVEPMLSKTEKMQLGLLTTQIDAHFIVNTIACIQILCKKGENKKAGHLAEGLNALIKYQHEVGETINIFKELEMLTQYIDIINVRNGERFRVSFDVDDLLAEYRMPGQVLQPIVENAFKHGFIENKKGYRICIWGGLYENGIYLTITDDGIGMGKELLDDLRNKIGSADQNEFPSQGLSGVALVNIQKRIRLQYGKKYGLTVDSSQNKGTAVTIRFPAIKDN